MTGMAQIFTFSFFLFVIIIFGYIIYNYAVNEVKKEYKYKKMEEGEELIKDLRKSFQNLKSSLNPLNNNTQTINNNSLSDLIDKVEKDILLLEDFIKNF
jgi:predicted PurR-regulated permease PerM